MNRLQKTILLLGLAFFALSITGSASAGILDLPQFEDPCDVCEFARLLSVIKNFVLEIAATIAVLFIIIGGVMMAASSGIPDQVQRAKKIITSAIIGLVILVCAWLIVSAIMAATLGGNIGSSWWTVTCPDDTKCVYQAPTTTPTTPTPPSTGGGALTGSRDGASGPLLSFLTCLESKVPEGKTWNITATTEKSHPECVDNGGNPLNCTTEDCKKCDSKYPDGRCPSNSGTCGQCSNLCVHGHYSCHYGGRQCAGSSYAVDIGSGADQAELEAAAQACEPKVFFKFETDHYHVSIGAANGCGCN